MISSDIKLRFKGVKLSVSVPWESGGTASVILGHYMGLSGHLHMLTTLCVNKEPLGHIRHEAGDSPEPVLLSAEQKCALNSMTTLCYFCKTSCTLHICSVQSIGNHRGGIAVLLKSVTYS